MLRIAAWALSVAPFLFSVDASHARSIPGIVGHKSERWLSVKMTSYCHCPICCGKWSKYKKTRGGVTPAHRFTVAADRRVFPIGSILYVEGLGEVMVQDVGGAVRGLHLDLYQSTHTQARAWGVRNVRVRVLHTPK